MISVKTLDTGSDRISCPGFKRGNILGYIGPMRWIPVPPVAANCFWVWIKLSRILSVRHVGLEFRIGSSHPRIGACLYTAMGGLRSGLCSGVWLVVNGVVSPAGGVECMA